METSSLFPHPKFSEKRMYLSKLNYLHDVTGKVRIIQSLFSESSVEKTDPQIQGVQNFFRRISLCVISLQLQPQFENNKFPKLYFDFNYCELLKFA